MLKKDKKEKNALKRRCEKEKMQKIKDAEKKICRIKDAKNMQKKDAKNMHK